MIGLVKILIGLVTGFVLLVTLGMFGIPMGPVEVAIVMAVCVIGILVTTGGRAARQ